MIDRYPHYDVLAKRHTPSWNRPTREVIAARLATTDEPHFLAVDAWLTLKSVCARIVPQPEGRPRVSIAALVDRKLDQNQLDGYRHVDLPTQREAWPRGLKALDAAARQQHDAPFHALEQSHQDALLHAMQEGRLDGPEWGGMPCATFFSQRVLHDILAAYWSHPVAWSLMGFGGPASPRGYVRLDANRRDPWEAVEEIPDDPTTFHRPHRHA